MGVTVRGRRTAGAYLAGGGLAVAVYPVVPDGTVRAVWFVLVAVSGVVAVLVGMRHHRPRHARAWGLMAAGLALWAAGDLTWSVIDARGGAPFPSAADAFYLASYPVIALGLAAVLRARGRGGVYGADRGALLDGAVVGVAGLLLFWVTLAQPIMTSQAPVLDRTVGVAYPLFDLLLIALLSLLLSSPGGQTPAFRLLGTGVLSLVVADTLYAMPSVADAAMAGPLLDCAWLVAYVAWGAAALHPSMALLTEDTPPVASFTRTRLIALTAAVLVAPSTLGVRLVLGSHEDEWAFVVASAVMFLLVVARMDDAIHVIRASTRERDVLAEGLAHAAAHDALTELTNRARVLELTEAALHRANRSGTLVGLLYVDLDHFKRVNDTYGHRAGDDVLRETARRMRGLVRAGDTVGRLGGDEFVVLVEQVASEEDLVALADRVVAVLAEPVRIGRGREVRAGASVGVAVHRDGSTDASALLHDADAAAYRAKAGGRGRAEIFDDALRRELAERAELEAALHAALELGELVLHYQPVVEAVSGRTTGYEALLRWERPGHGLVMPGAFIPTSERSSLVCSLGRWVLHEATAQLVAWTTADPLAFAAATVAVNVSGRHLMSDAVITDVRDALAASGLAPGRLVLEVTETVLVSGSGVTDRLATLRGLGVRISIDDFGTGYTSIGQLQNLNADVLKVDRSLVAAPGPGGAELLALVVQAAHAFGLTVVAEGVETEAQLPAVRDAGCDSIQGFLFARPLTADAVARSRGGVLRGADSRSA